MQRLLMENDRTQPDHQAADQADLWANWYGFDSASDMKKWGEQAERDRLAELAGKTDQQ